MSDHDDARHYADAAGRLLVDLRARPQASSAGPRALGDEGDAAANDFLLAQLRNDHPGDSVLSEESADDPSRLEASRVWIIDPLDGTREFSEHGRVDWAVHVALWTRNDGIRVGAVALPARAQVFATSRPPTPPGAANQPLKVVVSRSRPPTVAERIARALDAELISLGSAGAKTMAVVTGDADAYVHAGGQYEWDSAAPAAVARAAGLHVSRLDGSPLEYNRADPWLPDLLVCRAEITDVILAVTTG